MRVRLVSAVLTVLVPPGAGSASEVAISGRTVVASNADGKAYVFSRAGPRLVGRRA